MTYQRFEREAPDDLIAFCWHHHKMYHEHYGSASVAKTMQFIVEQQELAEFPTIV